MPKGRTSKPPSSPPGEFDARMMSRAISLARRGEGRVEPNPMVGCVIAGDGRVIAEGFHGRFGRAHAEAEALQACPRDPAGATAYVTLEPCSHHGKTGPCADLLIQAKIGRVVVALRDPNPAVNGAGIRRLRRAGIPVDVGLLAAEAAETLAPYLTVVCRKRPYIIAKWAQSLDGKLATASGRSRWISCEESRHAVHKLRARVDAVMVGSRTVQLDDPLLTARGVTVRRVARRIVIDGRLRIGEKCRLVATARDVPTLVMTSTERARSAKAKRLVGKGVEVIPCRTRDGHLALDACMAALARRDVTRVLVEGGAGLISALLESRLVDEALVFVAPKLIGGRGAPAVPAGKGVAEVADALTPRSVRVRRVGSDMLYRLGFTDPLEAAG